MTQQNPAPYHLSPDEVNKIRALVEKALASDTCKKFLNDLFAKVTALNPQNPITNRVLLGIFDKIKSQEKGGFFYVPETGRGGHADGSFSLNNAMVFSKPPFSHSPIPAAYQVASTFLNEVLHHIGDNDGTGDISFAQALGFQVPPNLNSLSLNELIKVRDAASGYWHPQVDKACPIVWHPGMR